MRPDLSRSMRGASDSTMMPARSGTLSQWRSKPSLFTRGPNMRHILPVKRAWQRIDDRAVAFPGRGAALRQTDSTFKLTEENYRPVIEIANMVGGRAAPCDYRNGQSETVRRV